jgi:threonine synthase
MWRYGAVLNFDFDPQVSQAEGETPQFRVSGPAQSGAGPGVFLKLESRNPTGSIEDRGMAFVITGARVRRISEVRLRGLPPAAISAASYATRAGIPLQIELPNTVSEDALGKCAAFGAVVSISTGGQWAVPVVEGRAGGDHKWESLADLRFRGIGTLAIETTEDLGWQLPSAIILPHGCGGIAEVLSRTFAQLEHLEWVEGRVPLVLTATFEERSDAEQEVSIGRAEAQASREHIAMQSGIWLSIETAAAVRAAERVANAPAPQDSAPVIVVDCFDTRYECPADRAPLARFGAAVREQSKLGGLITPR